MRRGRQPDLLSPGPLSLYLFTSLQFLPATLCVLHTVAARHWTQAVPEPTCISLALLPSVKTSLASSSNSDLEHQTHSVHMQTPLPPSLELESGVTPYTTEINAL